MKSLKISLAVAAAAAACVLLPTMAFAAEGPYVGGALGYNSVDDQTFDFSGQRTMLAQPALPAEYPLLDNSGIAASNTYKDDLMYQFVLGYSFSNGLRPEFELAYRQNKADTIRGSNGMPLDADGVKQTASSGMFNLWYDFFPSWKIHPYVGAGVGYVRFKLNHQPTDRITVGPAQSAVPVVDVCLFQSCDEARKADDAVLAYQLGAGVRWDVFKKVTLGLDYRYVVGDTAEFYNFKDQPETHLDSDYKTQQVLVSANFYFGGPAAPTPAPAPEPVAVVAPAAICADGLDNDGDGSIDFPNDKGCAMADDGDETDPPACSDGIDNDGDGVIDFPADKGCTAADDVDETNLCRTPALGERVSLTGCGTGDTIVLRGVNFEFDKARLTPNAKVILDNVSDELKANPQIDIELSGHTDAKGSDDYNQRLSERRAASVVAYLIESGIEERRLTSIGFGESKPVADNETEEGRELNRRVELKIIGVNASEPAPAATEESSFAPAASEPSPEPAAEPTPEASSVEPPPAAEPAADAAPAPEVNPFSTATP